MSAIPRVLLVLDISALSTATPKEWLEFSRIGTGYLPQVIYEEMKFLFDRSPDPDLERISRAFTRFYPTSGWQITDETASHAALKVASGQAMTKRSRVSLAVARCAYGLALNNPSSLIVLVTADRSLLQRVYDIQVNNLCGVTGPALLQWSRSGQRPIAVSQKLQQMRVPGGRSPQSSLPAPTASSRTVAGTPRTAIQTKTAIQPQAHVLATKPAWRKYLNSYWWALLLLAIGGLAAWSLVGAGGRRDAKPPNPVSSYPLETLRKG